jgi:hypothetical protein
MRNLKNKELLLLIVVPIVYIISIYQIFNITSKLHWPVYGIILFIPSYIGIILFLLNKSKIYRMTDYLVNDGFYLLNINNKILFILFTLLLSISFLNLHQNLTRNYLYYVLISLLFIIIFLTILNKKSNYKISLLLIIILSSFIISSIVFNRPLHFGGTDLLIHYKLIDYIASNNQFFSSSISNYNYFPHYFILNGITSNIFGISTPNTIFLISISLVTSLLLFIYILFSRGGIRFCLLLCLFFAVDGFLIRQFSNFIPRALSFYFYIVLMHIIFNKYKSSYNYRYNSIFLFISFVVITSIVLSHQVSNLFILIIFLLIIFINYIMIGKEKQNVGENTQENPSFFRREDESYNESDIKRHQLFCSPVGKKMRNSLHGRVIVVLLFFIIFISYWIYIATNFFSGIINLALLRPDIVDIINIPSPQTDFIYNTLIFIFSNYNYLLFISLFAFAFFVIFYNFNRSIKFVPILFLSSLFVLLYIPNPIVSANNIFREIYRIIIFMLPFFIFIFVFSLSFLIRYARKNILKKAFLIVIVFLWVFSSVFSTYPDRDNELLSGDASYFNQKDLNQFSFIQSQSINVSNLYCDYHSSRYFELFPLLDDNLSINKIKIFSYELHDSILDDSLVIFRYSNVNKKIITMRGYLYYDYENMFTDTLNKKKSLIYSNSFYNFIYV